MKPVGDKLLDELEDTALTAVKKLRAFLDYQGNDDKMFQRAKVAVGVVSAFGRIRASETNRMAVEQQANRSKK